MSLEKCFLFSSVSGVVHVLGRALKNVEVRQKCTWAVTGNEFEREARTNKFGVFHFEELIGTSGVARIVNDKFIEQSIVIIYNNTHYIAWQLYKTSYENNSELNGRSIILSCDLATKPKRHKEFGKLYSMSELIDIDITQDKNDSNPNNKPDSFMMSDSEFNEPETMYNSHESWIIS